MAPIRRLHALLRAHHQTHATTTSTSTAVHALGEAEGDQHPHLALLKPLLQPISAAFRRFVLDRYIHTPFLLL